jgi:hypothetical protein
MAIKITEEGKRTVKTERFAQWLRYLRTKYMLGHEIGIEPSPAELEEISEYCNAHEGELDEAIMAILYPPTKGTGYN